MHWCLVEAQSLSSHFCGQIHLQSLQSFFALGSMCSFHGNINPLTGQSIFEMFILSILIYGCETWILSPSLLTKLEKFQAKIGRRILGLSKYHADIAPLIGLHWPPVKARILIHKLSFLAKLLESDGSNLSMHKPLQNTCCRRSLQYQPCAAMPLT